MVFDTGESLFGGTGNNLSILQQTGDAVVIGIDA